MLSFELVMDRYNFVNKLGVLSSSDERLGPYIGLLFTYSKLKLVLCVTFVRSLHMYIFT